MQEFHVKTIRRFFDQLNHLNWIKKLNWIEKLLYFKFDSITEKEEEIAEKEITKPFFSNWFEFCLDFDCFQVH